MIAAENSAAFFAPGFPIANVATGEIELFDLRRDPGEREDLAPANPELADALALQLEAHFAGREAPASPVQPDARNLEQLRALGYLE